jgi:hypothetical protein
MPIKIPENIDLTQAERYILTIRIHPEEYSFSLHNPVDSTAYFYCPLKRCKTVAALRFFQDMYFDEGNEFFTLPYRKVYIVNYSPIFTYIPSLIFNNKDKSKYLDFLFMENEGKSLHHQLQSPEITILHTLPEKVYEFLQRSFIDAKIVHHTAPLIVYFQTRNKTVNRNKIVVNLQYPGLDVLCFSQETFLLGNHFQCNNRMDAVYYILFIWKQFKFDQLNDYVYIAGDAASQENLSEDLRKYIRNIVSAPVVYGQSSGVADGQVVPFEMDCLYQCEL